MKNVQIIEKIQDTIVNAWDNFYPKQNSKTTTLPYGIEVEDEEEAIVFDIIANRDKTMLMCWAGELDLFTIHLENDEDISIYMDNVYEELNQYDIFEI